MVISGGVPKMVRPLTAGEIQRGFTGRVTTDGRALIKFQGRIFTVPASRVSGLSARLARQRQQQAPRWTTQKQSQISESVRSLLLSSTSKVAITSRLESAQLARLQNTGFHEDSVGASRVPNAQNAALHEKYKIELRRGMAKPSVSDAQLSQIVDSLYRENAAIGSGSTADAVRFERHTGQTVGGRQHIQKAEDSIRSLERWKRNNPNASAQDKAATEQILLDLNDAIGK
ncbi:hypothetical protein [Candidatus Nitrotoga sp. AM1P]|uniref:hypothetical protein n=1 Tax=Candidatus Nitrotoga sp. AM1P TaxID=2559597 RepID=UPI001562F89E|nr:hypothetical protein [Candidatus Nitrotoga sp. AM1P]